MSEANTYPLFDQPSRSGGRPAWRLPREQFVDDTLAFLRDRRARGHLATREETAEHLHMDVSTFDRYRTHYDVFRPWSATVRAVEVLTPHDSDERFAAQLTHVPASFTPPALLYETDELCRTTYVAPDLLGWLHIPIEHLLGQDMAAIVRPGEDLVRTEPEATAAVLEMLADPPRRVSWTSLRPSRWLRGDGQTWLVETTIARITSRIGLAISINPTEQVFADGYQPELPPPVADPLLALVCTDGRKGVSTIWSVNGAACRELGFTRDELENAPFDPTLRPGQPPTMATRPRLVDLARRIREGEFSTGTYDTAWRRKPGDWARVAVRVQWLPHADLPEEGSWSMRGEILERGLEEPPPVEELEATVARGEPGARPLRDVLTQRLANAVKAANAKPGDAKAERIVRVLQRLMDDFPGQLAGPHPTITYSPEPRRITLEWAAGDAELVGHGWRIPNTAAWLAAAAVFVVADVISDGKLNGIIDFARLAFLPA